MRILIVKLSSIGDVVHALPAAAALRRALPAAKISWAVERRASEILKGSPVIDELIELDTRAWRQKLPSKETRADVRAVTSRLRGDVADIAIDFQGLTKSALVAKSSRARYVMGFETSDLREKLSRIFLDGQVQTSHISHVIEKNLALARAAIERAGGRSDSLLNSYEFPISITPDDEHYINSAVEDAIGGFAIINPGGGWRTKLWPAESYGRLSDWLWNEYGLHSFITYGPGEERLAAAVAENTQTGAARTIKTTLKQFAALARRASLFVGSDTGPLHIAAASGTPIVGIYGPTSPERNGPFDAHDVTVGRDLWCRERCHRRKCWHWQCMDIGVSEVMQAVSIRLSRANRQGSSKKEISGGDKHSARVLSFDV